MSFAKYGETTEKQGSMGVLFLLKTLFVVGAVIFLLGFFPVSISKTDKDNKEPLEHKDNLQRPAGHLYKQTILLIVDALRYDFPTAETMPFAYGTACSRIDLRVNIPTVTMPRLKSLTTGTISSFIDVVLNLGHDVRVEQSILHDLFRNEYKLVFAGDRTWVDLFPDIFYRKTPNMDSFFVNDFYEGDQNVTRELKAELQRDDWDLLILHYLGLDHIGHVEGSASGRIQAKLHEMDDAIRHIYSNKRFANQLVLVTGDHGMRNGGGHGGATWEELHVPLFFFKEKCSKQFANPSIRTQIDLAPTLAILMGIDIPKTSIGCLISELLEDFTLADQLQAYAYNAQHLLGKITAAKSEENVLRSDYHIWLTEARRVHAMYLQDMLSITLFESAKKEYARASLAMSVQLSSSLVDFDYEQIAIGLLLAVAATANVVLRFFVLNSQRIETKPVCYRQAFFSFFLAIGTHICLYALQYLHLVSLLNFAASVCFTFVIIYLLLDIFKLFQFCNLPSLSNMVSEASFSQVFCFLIFVFHICSLASSSFIEEEHRIWFYLTNSTFIVLLFGKLCNKHLLVVNIVILCRKLLNDIWVLRAAVLAPVAIAILQRYAYANESYKLQLHILGLVAIFISLRQYLAHKQWLLSTVPLLCTFFIRHFAANEKSSDTILIVFWISLGAITTLSYKDIFLRSRGRMRLGDTLRGCMKSNYASFLIIAALLHKLQNVILVSGLLYVLEAAYNLCNHKEDKRTANLISKILLTVFISKQFYFCQGNSNSLATIDLNPGYVGQFSFNAFTVFISVTFNTFSAPLLAVFYFILSLTKSLQSTEHLSTFRRNLAFSLNLYSIAVLLPCALYMCLLVLLRYHLFIYSVFAPKVFYEFSNVVVHYIMFIIMYLYVEVMLYICK